MNMFWIMIGRILDDDDAEPLPPTHIDVYPILNTFSICPESHCRPTDGRLALFAFFQNHNCLRDGFDQGVILCRRRVVELGLEDSQALHVPEAELRQNLDMTLHREAAGLVVELRLVRLDKITVQENSSRRQRLFATAINLRRIFFAAEIMERPGRNDGADGTLDELIPPISGQVGPGKMDAIGILAQPRRAQLEHRP